MNLRAIANGATAAVNPNTAALLRLPDKYRTDDAGRRSSTFSDEPVTIQAQALSAAERQQFDGLLQQGQMLSVYVSGQFHVLRRIEGKGAEKLLFAAYGESQPSEWLVKALLESWPNWCRVVVCRQN